MTDVNVESENPKSSEDAVSEENLDQGVDAKGDSSGQSEEENVEGFGETDSIEYIEVTDNVNPTRPINTNYNISKPRRRKSETPNIESGDLNDNLKNDTNYQNTAKRKMSLLDELRERIPEMVPKNMMEE